MTTPQCLADGMPTSLCEAALPPQRTEPLVARRWISHLEGRTLVEGIAEAFRHPEPDCPDPIAELQSISDEDMERICGDFVRRTYPEGKFSSDERERMGHAFRHRFIEGSRDAHAHFRREIAELQATLSDAAMQIEGRLAEAPCSDEGCRVLSAYFIVTLLRKSGVLASRRELQKKGILEPDCPVCLDMLTEGNGVVTFQLLECGHRIHEECLLKIKKTRTATGAVRLCPLCRGATRTTRAFALRGEMA